MVLPKINMKWLTVQSSNYKIMFFYPVELDSSPCVMLSRIMWLNIIMVVVAPISATPASHYLLLENLSISSSG